MYWIPLTDIQEAVTLAALHGVRCFCKPRSEHRCCISPDPGLQSPFEACFCLWKTIELESLRKNEYNAGSCGSRLEIGTFRASLKLLQPWGCICPWRNHQKLYNYSRALAWILVLHINCRLFKYVLSGYRHYSGGLIINDEDKILIVTETMKVVCLKILNTYPILG
jgi:hypothetical protein